MMVLSLQMMPKHLRLFSGIAIKHIIFPFHKAGLLSPRQAGFFYGFLWFILGYLRQFCGNPADSCAWARKNNDFISLRQACIILHHQP